MEYTMNGNITFTIITVCYNAEKTISRTIESVLNQTYKNYEYIIVDGRSTDHTMKIVEDYKPLFCDKIQVISEDDSGIYEAMNKGASLAKGEYLCFLNSDDWFETDALENVVKEKNNNKYHIIYGMQRTVRDGVEENCVIYSHNNIMNRMLCHQAVFATKTCFDDFGMFDTRYKAGADYDWMVRMCEHQEVSFTPVYKVLVNFQRGGMSESGTAMREMADIQYKNGFIDKKRYMFLKIKSIFI